jgi:predicted DNA-binding transcriptional regulator AlpA
MTARNSPIMTAQPDGLVAPRCDRHHVRVMTFPELFQLPTVIDLTTAGLAVGISVNTAYKLVQQGQFPCKVMRLGSRYQVPTMLLIKALGVDSPPVYLDDVAKGADFAARSAGRSASS